MINLIDFDLLKRIVNCIYNSGDDFGTNITQSENGLEKITIREDLLNGNGSPRFSIDKRLKIESQDGTDPKIIIQCFRDNGIHAN